jgi:hypothetical protein
VEIQPVGNGNYFIYLDGGDLTRLPPGRAGARELAELLPEFLRAENSDGAYIEIFPGNDAVLVFARGRAGAPSFFVFDGIEAVISAARAVQGDVITFLAHADGRYFLTFYPWRREPPPAALFEFGEPAALPSGFARHIAEHGRTLLGPSALRELREIF